MKKPEIILAAHRSGEINVHLMTLKDIANKFGCGEATACVARKTARKEDKVTPPKFGWQLVIDAHNEGRIDLFEETDESIADFMAVHHSVVERARRELGISKARETNPYAWYWHRWRKKYGVFKKWGVIPERVGLTKNQWLRRNESND